MLCEECNDNGRQRFVGQVIFKGNYRRERCEDCGDPLEP